MFDGIKLGTFLNTHQEWHALVIGLFEVLCPWPARYPLTGEPLAKLQGEHHYYMAGRGAGFVALLFILLGIAKIILEVLL